jgi:hypothetical protein
VGVPLHPYQVPVANYVSELVREGRTEDVVVEMSRQSGKNELSAHIETALLARYGKKGGVMVKAAPTWSPQIVRSKHRLEHIIGRTRQRLRLPFRGREGYIVQCLNASINFLSGRPHANVLGDTASLLLEIDEAQDFAIEKYNKEFAPMRASTGAPAIFYGTTWTDVTLLEQIKTGISEGRMRGKIFRVPWSEVAEHNPKYGRFVEGEILRLGREHPIIKTQYDLLPIEEAGHFLKAQQLKQIIGDHPRQHRRQNNKIIIASLDFAGADEETEQLVSLVNFSRRDSVALAIGELEFVQVAAGIILPLVKILDRYEWVNVPPANLHTTLYDILRRKWNVDRLHSDATGLGETGTTLLARALNKGQRERVVAVKFDAAWNAHTRLAFQYLAMIQGSRLLDYQPEGFDPLQVAKQEYPPDGDVSRHIWWQRGQARLETKSGQKVRTYVPDNKGHDDLLTADMLLVDAAYAYERAGPPGVLAQSMAKGWNPR